MAGGGGNKAWKERKVGKTEGEEERGDGGRGK